MIEVTRIQKVLQMLNDGHFAANPEEISDNLIGHSIELFSDGSGHFSAVFFYLDNKEIISFTDLDDLSETLKKIELGDNYALDMAYELEYEHDNS